MGHYGAHTASSQCFLSTVELLLCVWFLWNLVQMSACLTFVCHALVKRLKLPPYSLPSVWPRADPGVQAVSSQVTISRPPGCRLPLLSAVTFPTAEDHRPLAGTKLYCLVNRCEQLAQGCNTAFASSRIWTHDLLIASPKLYPLHHRATYSCLCTRLLMLSWVSFWGGESYSSDVSLWYLL